MTWNISINAFCPNRNVKVHVVAATTSTYYSMLSVVVVWKDWKSYPPAFGAEAAMPANTKAIRKKKTKIFS